MAHLTDTRVLVTGGTSGLGRAMARALAQAGARVAVTSRHREQAQATAAELGAGALGLELDVRDACSVSAAVDSAYGMLDGLDVLVNNAGIGMRTVNPRLRRLAAGAREDEPARRGVRGTDAGSVRVPVSRLAEIGCARERNG